MLAALQERRGVAQSDVSPSGVPQSEAAQDASVLIAGDGDLQRLYRNWAKELFEELDVR